MIAGALGDFDDVPVAVLRARIGLICGGLPVGAAVGVVRAGDVDAAVDRVRFDVFAAVHLRRSDLVGGQSGVDEDLFDGESGHLRLAVLDQRKPLSAAVELAVGGHLTAAVDLGLR